MDLGLRQYFKARYAMSKRAALTVAKPLAAVIDKKGNRHEPNDKPKRGMLLNMAKSSKPKLSTDMSVAMAMLARRVANHHNAALTSPDPIGIDRAPTRNRVLM